LPTSSAPGRGLALRYALGVLGLCPSGRCSRHLSTHFDGSARSLVCRRHFSSKSAAAAFFFNAAHLHDFGYHETEHGYHCIMSSTEVPVRNIGILPAHAPRRALAAPAHPPSRPTSSETLDSVPPWRSWQTTLSTRAPTPLRARRPRTFSSAGHHPARDGRALLSPGPHGQILRCGSSSSSSIFDDELNRRCAGPFPLLAWHGMTMPSSLCPMPPLRPRPWPHSRPPADPPGADIAAVWAAGDVAGSVGYVFCEPGTLNASLCSSADGQGAVFSAEVGDA
jgi:hypothetical protein